MTRYLQILKILKIPFIKENIKHSQTEREKNTINR